VSKARGIKIAELARRSNTPKETIHYYLRVGLLKRPKKTSRNMAYYDESHVEQLVTIKRLRTESYLPLMIIKRVLKEGRVVESARRADLPGGLFGQNARAELEPLSRRALLDRTGLGEAAIERYERAGLLRPVEVQGVRHYRWEDVRAAELLASAEREAASAQEGPEWVIERFQILERHAAELVREETDHFFGRVLAGGDPEKAIELLRSGRETIGRYLAIARVRRLRDEVEGIFREVEGALRGSAPLRRRFPAKLRAKWREPAHRHALEAAHERDPHRVEPALAWLVHLVSIGDCEEAMKRFVSLEEKLQKDPEIALIGAEAMVECEAYDAALEALAIVEKSKRRRGRAMLEACLGAATLGRLKARFARSSDGEAPAGFSGPAIIRELTLGLSAITRAHGLEPESELEAARLWNLLGRVETITPAYQGIRELAARDLERSRKIAVRIGAGFGVSESIEWNALLFLLALTPEGPKRAELEARIAEIEGA
jgi:DNA-binding transcriptional MerR regulator